MFSLGAITFLSPWLLGATALIPVLWWLLRVMPPRPRTVHFPVFFLLKELKTDIKTAARTPWWLLLLRSLLVACFILALADPVLKLSAGLPGGSRPLLIAVDNGWASAAHWQQRQDRLKEYLHLAARDDRAVILLPTAPSSDDGKVHSFGPMTADEAIARAERLQPTPWPADHQEASKAIKPDQAGYALYLSDGTAQYDTPDLLKTLQASGGLTLVKDDQVNDPFILRRTSSKPGELSFTLERLRASSKDENMSLAAFADEGVALDQHKFVFPAGKTSIDLKWDVLSELRNKIARISLSSHEMASGVFLTDSRWRQHPVGIAADPSLKNNQSFLNEVYYLKRALEDNGTPAIDRPEALIKQKLSAIIWPDSAPLGEAERVSLQEWVEGGGFLIRFAGPVMAAGADDPLLPVPLRFGQRAMQGAMTWEKPVRLGAIPPSGPLAGLDVPTDVTVTRQVLADPTPEVFEKTWLQLEDGTPLITGGAIGKGAVALVHTTAGPDWSDFCYSGLYVETLRRMIALSTGIGDYKGDTVLPPLMVMDGFGHLQPADTKGIVAALDPHAEFTPGPRMPPGLYGDARQFRVFNLGDALGQMQPLKDIPDSITTNSYQLSGEKSLKPDFFKWALWLLLFDTLATLWLRGALARTAVAGVVLAMLLQGRPAQAENAEPADLATGIYLAYVETGDQGADQISYSGLTGLRNVVNARTTIKIEGVRGVNPAIDPLYFYPLLYWPMTQGQQALSSAAARNIQDYLATGGMILFDTRDGQFGDTASATIGASSLRSITQDIRIPELAAVEEGHILTRSFYLLNDFPGLYDSGKIWVEKEPDPAHDGVTSVIIGGNDWAAAWSFEPSDRARFNVEGGEKQREMAYRFGVNVMMAALAGNYKADQVHIPYILERLKQ